MLSPSAPSRWFIVRDSGGTLVTMTRDIVEAQAARGPGGTITEGAGTVCDPLGNPSAE